MIKNYNILTSFLKYNTVAIIATVVDFMVFVLLNDILNIWYIVATFLSSVTGGGTAFILNLNWVFKSNERKINYQIIKYFLVWGGSILLNTYGLYFLVENSNFSEIVSKITVSIFVGITYNYLTSRYFIFK